MVMSGESSSMQGFTALHEASMRDNVQKAQLLIDNGASVNAVDQEGKQPLHSAIRDASTEMAQLLIDKGASVDAADQLGYKPLHLSATFFRVDMAQLLIDKGASVNAATQDGSTALHMVTGRGNPEMAQLLIDKGASVNAATQAGSTVLHMVARNDNTAMAQLLIDNGASVNAVDPGGDTPFLLAVCRSLAIALFLLRAMAARGTVPVEMASAPWSNGDVMKDYLKYAHYHITDEEGGKGGVLLRGTGLRAMVARERQQMHPNHPPSAAGRLVSGDDSK